MVTDWLMQTEKAESKGLPEAFKAVTGSATNREQVQGVEREQ